MCSGHNFQRTHIMAFSDKDIEDQSKRVIDVLQIHEVQEDMQYSITSDIMFSFSNLLDEKTGTNFHERIDGLMDELFED